VGTKERLGLSASVVGIKVGKSMPDSKDAQMIHPLREQVMQTAQRMAGLGLARGSSGNVSRRAGERILITASGIPYEALHRDQVIEIDYDGKRYSGNGDPSSEWRMHAEIYRMRKDVQAIVHTHSPFATAAAVVLRSLPVVHDEGRILFGEALPVSAHASPGTWDLAKAVANALADGKATLIGHHGAVTVGSTLQEALALAEKVEETAQLFWLCEQIERPKDAL
jgi:L-fuculose-phosphate aldolase